MDLSRRSGISIDSLRNWEQARALPRVDAVVLLASVLGVSVDKLVEGIEVKPPEEQPARPRGRPRKSETPESATKKRRRNW
jgi:transcriptional regulator with XRE-family HTH domain